MYFIRGSLNEIGRFCCAFVNEQHCEKLLKLCFASYFASIDAFPRTAASKRAPAPRSGGDDLEDDGYYDPEDVPDVPFEADGTEDQFGVVAGSATGKVGVAAAAKKKSKVVMF